MPQLTREQRLTAWTDRFARFQSCSLTVAQFCQREQISVPSFYKWRKKLKSDVKARPSRNAKTNGMFVPLTISHHTAHAVVQLPGGASIQLPADLQAAHAYIWVTAIIDGSQRSGKDGQEPGRC